ncbi:PAS domain S-box protein [Nostocoides sp. HKS02]|uniref:PAS domain S-box protein n=1 Tax=Nostocoides sp. HKS02 TaxID=1813880 RepID=UPI0012B4EE79|nr:PAS domain S-box protein [Tetrasphaera sp. HKS02]QGN57258.1 PAS domain S-box protein [Tetrasphaera sp. HKS02]
MTQPEPPPDTEAAVRRPPSSAPADRLADRLGVAVYRAEPGPVGRWLSASRAVTAILGFTPEQLLADAGLWLAQLHPDDRDAVLEREASLAASGRVCSEYRVLHPDGQVVWVMDDAVVEQGDGGEDVLHGFLIDITNRKRTELMLATHADVVEAVAGGTAVDAVLTALADGVAALSGTARCTIEVFGDGATQPFAVTSDGWGADADGHAGAVREAPVLSPSGETLGRLSLRYPAAARRRAMDEDLPAWAARLAALAVVRAAEHAAMATSVALLTATLESTVDGILVVDPAGRIAGHNQRFATMWRIDPDLLAAGDDAQVMGSVLAQLVDPAAFVAQVQHLYNCPDETSFDDLAFLDGRMFERYSQPQRVDGQPVGRVWSFRDVTDKRRLEADLRDTRDNLSLLVGQVRDYAILNLDPAGHVITWNAGAERIKGYTEQEILGQHFSVFYPQADVAAGKPALELEAVLAEGHVTDEGWRVRKDGTRFWASVVISALRDDQGSLRGFGMVTRDITEQHQAKLALHRQASTLELLGAVATASNSAASVEEALAAALEAFARFGSWQLAHAYLTDHDDRSALRHSVWYEQPLGAFAGFRAATEAARADEVKLAQEVFARPDLIWLSSLEDDPRFGRVEEAAQAGLVSACAFPILVRDEPVGVLEFFSTQPQDCHADMLSVMAQVGAQLGRVVERDRAEHRVAAHSWQLERLTSRLEMVLNSAGDGIYGLDASGIVTFINDAGATLVGLPAEAVVGRPVTEVIMVEPGLDAAYAAGTARGDGGSDPAPRSFTGRHVRADGTVFDSESIAAPIVADGTIAGSVVVFRDISERRTVERLKDQFISVVSHELRTPLTSVRGALGLLAGGAAGPLAPKAARMVDVATTSTDRLIRLITDILDLERMTAGHLTVHPQPTAAEELIAAAVDETAVFAQASQVGITVGATCGRVLADRDRVIQILSNLVGNAVKFSEPGSAVQLCSTLVEGYVRFDVTDQGPGIAADQLEAIFEPFRQVDASDTRRHGGTGLGLAICRGIVEQHHGLIWATSEPGRGSTFSLHPAAQ